MKGSLTVYWINEGTNTVGSGEVQAIEDNGRTVRFTDGGWNWTSDCYLTAAQARRARGLPEPRLKLERAAVRVSLLLSKASELLESELPQSGQLER